jgi:hypothetical protein
MGSGGGKGGGKGGKSGGGSADIYNQVDLYPFGQLWDVHIQRRTDESYADLSTTEPYVFLGRFLMKGKNPNGQKRSMSFRLAKGRYSFMFDPVPQRWNGNKVTIDGIVLNVPDEIPFYEINDGGEIKTLSTGVTLNGSEVQVVYEGKDANYNNWDADQFLNYNTNQRSASSESGPTTRIATVNEIITADSTPSGVSNYPGLTRVEYTFTASDKITQAPNQSIIINKGLRCRNHIATGYVSSTTVEDSITLSVLDSLANFTGTIASGGSGLSTNPAECYLRNLDKSAEVVAQLVGETGLTYSTYTLTADLTSGSATITASHGAFSDVTRGMPVSGNGIPPKAKVLTVNPGNYYSNDTITIGIPEIEKELPCTLTGTQELTINGGVTWTTGDEYLVYFLDSSSYYPDVFVHMMRSTQGGLGAFIDEDREIDYPSIVESRQFCIKKGYFFDYVFSSSVKFLESVNRQSMSSLLFPSKSDGKYSLTPEEYRVPIAVLNGSNSLRETYEHVDVPWNETAVNRLTVSYLYGKDGRFLPRSFVVLTPEAYNGTEPLVEDSLELVGVTTEAQAIDVGCVYLKSKRLQGQTLKLKTATQGLYLRPQELMVVQHPCNQLENEFGGTVVEVGSFASGVQSIRLNSPTLTVDSSYTANIWFRGTANTNYQLPVLDAGEGFITISGLSEEINIGDYVTVGIASYQDVTYRIASVNPDLRGEMEVSGVIWVPDILTKSGIYLINFDGGVFTSQDDGATLTRIN